MLSKTPHSLPPLLTIHTFKPPSSWLIEPTSVLDIRSPSPTCTSLSSFLRSSTCQGGGLLLPKEAVVAVGDHGDPLPDCTSLLEIQNGSGLAEEEEKNDGSCEAASAGMGMAEDCTLSDHMEGISGLVGVKNSIEEGSSCRVINNTISAREAMVASFTTMQAMKQQGNNNSSNNNNGHVQEMQKTKSIKEGGPSSSSQCSEGGDHDQNMMAKMMMMMQKLDHHQQQQSSLTRSEDQWLNPDFNSFSGCEFGVGDPELKSSLVGMDDLESMLLSSSPLPPPPDQSLMKLLFGEGDQDYNSNTPLLHSQQQLISKPANLSGLPVTKDSQQQLQQQMQMDLQEAMEAHFASSSGTNPQTVLLSPSLPFSDPYFPCPSSPTFPSNLPPVLPYYVSDQYKQHPSNLPLAHDTSISAFPQSDISKDTSFLPLSYASNSLESKRGSNQAKLLPSPSSTNPSQNPTCSAAMYSRTQKLMMEKLPMSNLPSQLTTPSCPLSSMPSVGNNYMQQDLIMQRKRFRGSPQAEELLQKAIPWQLNADQKACTSRVPNMQGRGEMKRMGAQWVQRGKVSTEEMHVMGLDQLLKAAEAMELGNMDMAHGILARLNQQHYLAWPQQIHQGMKALQRAAFYLKEALLNLLNNSQPGHCTTSRASPLDILDKITAYTSFCESFLLPQFAHFTSNQAILEAMEGENCIHLIDFELGLGGHWASFLQEIASRPSAQGPVKVKLTAIGLESIEMQLIRENLYEFAHRLNISIQLQLIPITMLENLNASMSEIEEGDAIAINFGSSLSSLLDKFSAMNALTAFLQLIKALSPRVITVMELESECDHGFSFSRRFLYSLEYYASLFASLESTTGLPMKEVLKIEKLLFAPKISASLLEGRRINEKLFHWHNLFKEAGFFPLALTPAAETQAECMIQSPQACSKGFHLSKSQGSLLLGWHGRTLVSASAWSC